MNTFASAILAAAVSARGTHGGIKQGATNSSVGGQHGFGYNVGNGYEHGNSHGEHMGHNLGTDSYAPLAGAAYTMNNTHNHIVGYDTVEAYDADDWTANRATPSATQVPLIKAAVDAA